jgi:hypothetical protein
MVDTIVGGALALVLLGLPLATIGLFVQSVLARRSALRAELQECPARLLSPHRPQRRRRVLASPPLYPLLRPTPADHAEPAAPLGPRPHAETTHVSNEAARCRGATKDHARSARDCDRGICSGHLSHADTRA